nr:hypothetical protein [Tanacetum cinerariifolium]
MGQLPLSQYATVLLLPLQITIAQLDRYNSDMLLVLDVRNKMHKAFPLSVMEFPLPEEVPTSTHRDVATTGSTSDGTGKKKGRTVTLTTDDMQKRKKDVKARTTFLLSLPDEHQLRFTEGSETLEQMFNRLQAPKALMAIDEVGWDWSYMANDEENHALVADEEASTEFALMAKTSVESEVFDNFLCSKAWLAQVEARLVEHRNQELKYCEKIRVLEFKTESRANYIESLTKDLELLKKEKGKLETKLTGFQTASKDLDNLLESQRLDKNKEGLVYNVVPPLPAQVYTPPKKDMSWTGLSEFKDDIVTDYSRPSPAIESTSHNAQNRNPSVTKTEASPSTISPKPFIKFIKATDRSTETKTTKVKTAKPAVKYDAMYSKP